MRAPSHGALLVSRTHPAARSLPPGCRDVELVREPLGEPIDRRRESEILEQRGPQLAGDLAHRFDRRVETFQRVLPGAGSIGAEPGPTRPAIDATSNGPDRGQPLAELVMDLARDTGLLLLDESD